MAYHGCVMEIKPAQKHLGHQMFLAAFGCLGLLHEKGHARCYRVYVIMHVKDP